MIVYNDCMMMKIEVPRLQMSAIHSIVLLYQVLFRALKRHW